MKNTLLLIISLSLLLTACSSQEATVETDVTSSSESETTTIENNDYTATIYGAELLQNKAARIAIAEAIDKEFITNVILANGAEPVDYLVPQGIDAVYDSVRVENSQPIHPLNLDEAKKNWQKAREELEFKTATLTFLTYDSKGANKMADFIKQTLEENLDGLLIEIEALPFKQKNQRSQAREYDIEFLGWEAELPSAKNFIQLFNQQLANDADFVVAENELLEEVKVIPLYQKGELYLQNTELTGVETRNFGASLNFEKANKAGAKEIEIALPLDVISLDSSKLNDEISELIAASVFDSLTKLDTKGELVFSGAEKCDISEDGLTYTFKLRKDAKFSNGESIRASDYLYAFQRLASLRFAGKNSQYLLRTGIKNAKAVINEELAITELGVSAPTEDTLVVTLDKENEYLLKLLSLPVFSPIRQSFAEEQAHNYGKGVKNVLYSGAFILADRQKGSAFRLEKNPNYWNSENVLPSAINFKIIKNAKEALQAYQDGEADRVYLAGKTSKEKSKQALKKPVIYFLRLN